MISDFHFLNNHKLDFRVLVNYSLNLLKKHQEEEHFQKDLKPKLIDLNWSY